MEKIKISERLYLAIRACQQACGNSDYNSGLYVIKDKKRAPRPMTCKEAYETVDIFLKDVEVIK